jgi:multiple sugar transport system ATP-binding protein
VARVEFVEVSKRYRGVLAVNGVSLDVRDQEFLVLLGPSGCGKSTLLKMVAGLEEITEGEIYINDRLVNYVPPQDRDVAMVFQNYALYPHMTVFDNIAFPLKMQRVRRDTIHERVVSVSRILGLQELLQRRPEHLSGGQRQRVALGRAIIRNPKVFLMDEPLSNLDALLRVQTREELLRIHQRIQGTVIYVTHDQVEAMTMGDRVVVMKDGVIHQVGAPQAVYDQPVNTYVATFIGTPAMSMFRGHVQVEDGQANFVATSMRVPLPGRCRVALEDRHLSADVTLGVRSEHVLVSTGPQPGAVEARVALVEPVGSDMFVSLAIGETPCVARTEPRSDIAEGQTIWLTFVPERLHVFDSAGRNVLTAGGAPVKDGKLLERARDESGVDKQTAYTPIHRS